MEDMKNFKKLRLLASTNNARGDLFTRLVGDLFFALGYDDLRFDVHKSGREIDVIGEHRLEPRRLVGECKAHAKKMGGSELNKFFGVVNRERSRDRKTPVMGYFVSLNGFSETGLEQEANTNEQERNILLDGNQIIQELIRIRIIIKPEGAVEQAGRCVAQSGLGELVLEGLELLGHELGYVWAVYYSQGKRRTHVALIHADGAPLAFEVAEEIIEADRKCRGSLHKLSYLAPRASNKEQELLAKQALERYRQWVLAEFGNIQLDGLPADSDLSAFSMKLERLFVPLKIQSEDDESVSAGEFLAKYSRFSLLAKPGGGKSTLLKRMAVAYADPERLALSQDDLPANDWLPLILRCRELRERAHRPIRELLNDLSQHAAMSTEEESTFRILMDEAMQAGRVLLLVDGLDEISETSARIAFAGHLRTFLSMFPKISVVMTSREAGYRQVAGVIANTCKQVSLASFDKLDVQQLCENWHAEVVGNNEAVRAESIELADTIWENERIRELAENPLMLTTLLVVRRCIGELPTRRVALYREAVRVLIYTWNTEGFEPMDLEETLAQISYVAYTMMLEGNQQIGRQRLLKLLQKARDEMQEELQFTQISPGEFIERIEYRSSLLVQTGHEEIDGEFQPVYEFRHLTFQEYLAARGLVAEQYPGRTAGRSLVEMLEPNFTKESWREIIPLAAVLAGRKAEPLISRLSSYLIEDPDRYKSSVVITALRQCLLDEVLVTPTCLQQAILTAARTPFLKSSWGDMNRFARSLLRGKFSQVFEKTICDHYMSMSENWQDYAHAMKIIANEKSFGHHSNSFTTDKVNNLCKLLESGERLERALSAFQCMSIAFEGRLEEDSIAPHVQIEQLLELRESLGNLISHNDLTLALPAAWALAWFGERGIVEPPPSPELIVALFSLWRHADVDRLRGYSGWAFGTQPLLDRNAIEIETWGDCDEWLVEMISEENLELWDKSNLLHAYFVLAWYRRSPWSDKELVNMLVEAERPKFSAKKSAINALLNKLRKRGSS